MTIIRKTFEQYHIHLSLTTEDDKYICPETQAAWRTWRACKDAVIQRVRKTESYYVNVGNPLKAQVAATVRKSLLERV